LFDAVKRLPGARKPFAALTKAFGIAPKRFVATTKASPGSPKLLLVAPKHFAGMSKTLRAAPKGFSIQPNFCPARSNLLLSRQKVSERQANLGNADYLLDRAPPRAAKGCSNHTAATPNTPDVAPPQDAHLRPWIGLCIDHKPKTKKAK